MKLTFGFLGEEGITGEVKVGEVLGAAPHQGTEQHLRGDVRGAEVQDRDHVRLGQEVNQALNLVLEQKQSFRTDTESEGSRSLLLYNNRTLKPPLHYTPP